MEPITQQYNKEPIGDKFYEDCSQKEILFLYKHLELLDSVRNLSYCNELKVGAIAFRDKMVIGLSYNGTPRGFDNCCEDEIKKLKIKECETCKGMGEIKRFNKPSAIGNIVTGYKKCKTCKGSGKITDENNFEIEINTSPLTLHAEENLVANCARAGISLDNTTILVSTAPCFKCARLLLSSGVSKVVFVKEFKNNDGIDILVKGGVTVYKILPDIIKKRMENGDFKK